MVHRMVCHSWPHQTVTVVPSWAMNRPGGLNLSLRNLVGSSLSPPFILTSPGSLDAGFEKQDDSVWLFEIEFGCRHVSKTLTNIQKRQCFFACFFVFMDSVAFPSSQVCIHRIHLTDTMLVPVKARKAAIIQRPAVLTWFVFICFHVFLLFPVCFSLFCNMLWTSLNCFAKCAVGNSVEDVEACWDT